jgi:hypothetical protein
MRSRGGLLFAWPCPLNGHLLNFTWSRPLAYPRAIRAIVTAGGLSPTQVGVPMPQVYRESTTAFQHRAEEIFKSSAGETRELRLEMLNQPSHLSGL